MRKILAIVLTISMTFSLAACGKAEAPVQEEIVKEVVEETDNQETEIPQEEATASVDSDEDMEQEPVSEEEEIEDEAWDELEGMGSIQTENGVFYVNITFPAAYVPEGATQESLENDPEIKGKVTSVTLNEDGTMTYKMTKRQHKEMLDELAKGFDETLEEMISDDEYAFSEITHNKDFTQFDVTLETEDLELREGLSVLAFYLLGGMYNIFTGKEDAEIFVNFYNNAGNLITTTSSADLDE